MSDGCKEVSMPFDTDRKPLADTDSAHDMQALLDKKGHAMDELEAKLMAGLHTIEQEQTAAGWQAIRAEALAALKPR